MRRLPRKRKSKIQKKTNRKNRPQNQPTNIQTRIPKPHKTHPNTNPKQQRHPALLNNRHKKLYNKKIGLTQFLDKIAEQTGLRHALKQSNPKYHQEIFTLAKHLTTNNEPFMHCQEWLKTVEISENIANLTSQTISKILTNITINDIESFHQQWAKKRSEKEYLALDITSTSSYSGLIENVEWGYNRDGENLAQVNLCMLMGETSRLPIYQTIYQGFLRDVTTLKTTFEKFDAITGGREILAVMDKGFYSKKNVDDLVAEGRKFVIAVPFSSGFAKNQVDSVRDSVDCFSNNIRPVR